MVEGFSILALVGGFSFLALVVGFNSLVQDEGGEKKRTAEFCGLFKLFFEMRPLSNFDIEDILKGITNFSGV